MSRRRALLWGLALAPPVLLVLGFMLPNGAHHEIAFWWWWSWVLPLRATLLLCLATGVLAGAAAGGVLWWGEYRRRRQAELLQQAVEGEVNALRRLLGRPAEPVQTPAPIDR